MTFFGLTAKQWRHTGTGRVWQRRGSFLCRWMFARSLAKSRFALFSFLERPAHLPQGNLLLGKVEKVDNNATFMYLNYSCVFSRVVCFGSLKKKTLAVTSESAPRYCDNNTISATCTMVLDECTLCESTNAYFRLSFGAGNLVSFCLTG